MMPLTMAKPGETVTIRRVTGRDEGRQHLAELGFVVDSPVTAVNELCGSLILQVRDGRIALGSQVAQANPARWEELRGEWTERFSTIPYEVSVQVSVSRTYGEVKE